MRRLLAEYAVVLDRENAELYTQIKDFTDFEQIIASIRFSHEFAEGVIQLLIAHYF